MDSFNPHTHEGCDIKDFICNKWTKVSIHTPTKGVTFDKFLNIRFITVSIHTPTKGVTKSG